MFIELPTAIEMGMLAWQERDRLKTLAGKVRSLWRNGHLRIAVFGAGGTGKTTLARMLAGEKQTSATEPPYEESPDNEDFPLKADLVATLLVAPGQSRRRINNWPQLYASLAEGESGGVIYVASYGYHSIFGQSYKDVQSISSKNTKSAFIKEYTEARRREELDVIKELVPYLSAAKRQIWMLTLVTKQDLWWPERNKVRDFYTNGEYNSYIEQISRNRGAQNFAHDIVSASLINNNFVDGENEVLKSVAAGYDANIQRTNLQYMLKMLLAYAKRKTR